MRDETIYAVATGAGRAAIAIVRVSGPACDVILSHLCPGAAFPDRAATFAAIRGIDGALLDHGLIIRFRAPRSFTGEDLVEFQVTGSRAVLKGLLEALASFPTLRPAEAGEFALRAFLNGKRDLSEIEGLASLVEAETSAQLRHALRMAGGDISRQCEAIRGQLLRTQALVETMLDFSDIEDAADLSTDELLASVSQTLASVEGLLTHEETEIRLREGMTVVIAGPPNVGKSTLFNALAQRDVAIVSATPGTTRDTLEFHAEIDGFPVTFVDTAGLRSTEDPVEAEGVARGRKRSAAADLTLWLRSVTEPVTDFAPPGSPFIVVWTKADLQRAISDSGTEIQISAQTGEGIAALLGKIAAFAREHFVGAGNIGLGTARQRRAAREAAAALRRITQQPTMATEVLAEDLRLAVAAMGRITGRIEVEEMLGDIFSRLCVGK